MFSCVLRLYKIGFSSRTCILTTQRGWLTLRLGTLLHRFSQLALNLDTNRAGRFRSCFIIASGRAWEVSCTLTWQWNCINILFYPQNNIVLDRNTEKKKKWVWQFACGCLKTDSLLTQNNIKSSLNWPTRKYVIFSIHLQFKEIC